ncbi:MAG: Abi family protein [Bacilli bacterium]|nr:Abi family protein [Bacilli bacterium]MDD4809049.1 Abi family protein [Bacilli bacterium]
MKDKVFRNLDQQVDILKSKGLVITDNDQTKEILFRENYFFISGYRRLFMRSNKDTNFIDGTTFDELYATFVFDRKLRNILFKHILMVENNVKSIISYQLSRKYGYRDKDYLNPKNFTQDDMKHRQIKDIISKMKRQIRVNGCRHTATMHYLNNYGYIPMWVLVKILSFGIVSELFSILKEEDQIAISEVYDIEVDTLSIYLSMLANYRNLCAHEDILYDHRTQRSIPNTRFHYRLDIEMTDDEYIYGKNDLYAIIIIMKQMHNEEEFKELINEIGYEVEVLDGKVDTVPLNTILNKIGFPDNWREIVNIK